MATIENGAIIIDTEELRNLLRLYKKQYGFTHKNEKPVKFILPVLREVDGVEVEMDYAGLIKEVEVAP